MTSRVVSAAAPETPDALLLPEIDLPEDVPLPPEIDLLLDVLLLPETDLPPDVRPAPDVTAALLKEESPQDMTVVPLDVPQALDVRPAPAVPQWTANYASFG